MYLSSTKFGREHHPIWCQSEHPPQQTTVVRLGGGDSDSCKRSVSLTHYAVTGGDKENVTHCTVTEGEIFSSPAIPPVRLRQDRVGHGQRWNKNHKTWNQNTLVQDEYECGIGRQERRKGKERSVQNFDFFHHNYENVFDNNNIATAAAEDLEDLTSHQVRIPIEM
jgi:hypothetical protein